MERIYELGKILSGLEHSKEDYYVDFLNTKSFEAGIIRLRKDQEDTQSTHPVDEIYYVIEGEGLIRIGGQNYEVCKGKIVFRASQYRTQISQKYKRLNSTVCLWKRMIFCYLR